MTDRSSSREDEFRTIEVKMVVIGDSGVGKTSSVLRYTEGKFSPDVPSTPGAMFVTKRATVDDWKIKLQIWDTAGQEKFRTLTPMYYREASAAVLVYDITVKKTFEDLRSWASELLKHVPEPSVLVVAGNKLDLSAQRQVPRDDAAAYARTLGALYFEISAKDNTNIDALFARVFDVLCEKRMELYNRGRTSIVIPTAAPRPPPSSGCC